MYVLKQFLIEQIEQEKLINIENERKNSEDETNEETNQTIIQEQVSTNNQYEIAFLSISAIFLMFTIIFFSFFVKHQLNRKHKSSK